MSKWIKIEDAKLEERNVYQIGVFVDKYKDESLNGFKNRGFAIIDGGRWKTIEGFPLDKPTHICPVEKTPFDAEVEVKKVYSEEEVKELFDSLSKTHILSSEFEGLKYDFLNK